MSSTAPVDLSISEGSLSYSYEGTELQVFVLGTLLLTWFDVDGENVPTHTVQIGYGPSRSLTDILSAQLGGGGDVRVASEADTVLKDISSGGHKDDLAIRSTEYSTAVLKLVDAMAAFDGQPVVSPISVDRRAHPSGTSLAILR